MNGYGDFNNDAVVTDADATILATNWQTGVNPLASVPEPATWMLLATAMVVFSGYSKLRQSGPHVD